jgi:hypothetical protein
MAEPIFKTGVQGLSDSLWSGTEGSCSKLVGIDYRTKPGTFQAHQKLSKHSSTVVTELCKNVINVSDGSRLWFSSESGKIWREVAGTYTLVWTTSSTLGESKCLGAIEYNGDVYWATQLYIHKISTLLIGTTWTNSTVRRNWKKFSVGDDTFHPMTVQNLKLYIGDNTTIASVYKELVQPQAATSPIGVSFSSARKWIAQATNVIPPAGVARFPKVIDQNRDFESSSTTVVSNMTLPVVPNGYLQIWTSSLNTAGGTPDYPSAISYVTDAGTQTPTSTLEISDDLGGGVKANIRVYQLKLPNSGAGVLTVTYPGTNTNIVTNWMFFQDGDGFSFGSSDSESTGTGSASLTFSGFNYQVPVMLTRSAGTGAHTAIGNYILGTETGTSGGYRDSLVYFNAHEDPEFTDRTELNVVSPERIQTIKDFDIDILIGTRVVNKGRVLRWDGVSEGWSAQDDIEEQGINAFIRDDNYMYVQAGFYGRMYFYNGEKLDPFKRIPGDWSPTKTAKINPNATAFHLGVPVFGLSNVAGNPTLQGVYGFGSYGVGYPKTLSLDFPIPTNVFEGVEIGSMVADGADLYVSYKDATDVGVAKLDWANKYNGAYLETNALMGTENRSDFTNIDAVNVDYTDLPTSTGITIAYKKNYDSTFTTLSGITFPKLKQVKARETITDIANLILKISLTTNTNATPNVENVSIGL